MKPHKKNELLDRLESARLKRMLARDAAGAAFEAAHETLGEFKRPYGPANARSGDFVRDRVLEKSAGAKKGWRKRVPLQAAYEKGQLAGGNPAQSALARYEAGMRYVQLFQRASSSGGRDSTDMDRVTGGGGGARDLPPGQMRALAQLAKIEALLAGNDRRIIRDVCGFEYTPAQVMRDISPDYRDRVGARLCEALDSLIMSWSRVR